MRVPLLGKFLGSPRRNMRESGVVISLDCRQAVKAEMNFWKQSRANLCKYTLYSLEDSVSNASPKLQTQTICKIKHSIFSCSPNFPFTGRTLRISRCPPKSHGILEPKLDYPNQGLSFTDAGDRWARNSWDFREAPAVTLGKLQGT